MTFTAARQAALASWLERSWQATTVSLRKFRRLKGGAIAENFGFHATVEGGEQSGEHDLVLRYDAPVSMPGCRSRSEEFAIVKAAFDAGVRVPEPLVVGEDPAVAASEFFVMRQCEGVALPRAVFADLQLADPQLASNGDELVADIGAQLALLHRLRPPFDAFSSPLAFLDTPEPSAAEAHVNEIARQLDLVKAPQPVIEWGLRHLRRYAPPHSEVVLCHRDLRIGNVLVDHGRLSALLDFEFAALGDPHEDLGWFCARCWRHSHWVREAGGVGSRAAFYRGYEFASETPVDHARVRYYELLAVVRWAVIALLQGQRWLATDESALDLVMTGRRVAEMELEILQLIDELRSEPQRYYSNESRERRAAC